LPIITTTTTTTTIYTHLILATLSFYFWAVPNFFCRMPNFMRPGIFPTFAELGRAVANFEIAPTLGLKPQASTN
jgi:hypothetical protein